MLRLRRADAVAALLRLVASDAICGAVPVFAARGGRDALCSAGVACGLFEDPLLCQADAGLSGSEAIEMLRRALDRLEDA